MAYRFTNTEKWNDSWFSELKPVEKLLFVYLCDNCDIAGFIEINYKKWAIEIGVDIETVKGGLKGLERGLKISDTNDCIYIKNFLKHQKNLPLNDKNQSHKGIIKRFELYSLKFKIKNLNEFIMGALSPYGNGNGNGNKGGVGEKEITRNTWRTSFDVYKNIVKYHFEILMKDKLFISEQERLNPGVDIRLTMEKSYLNFWITEAGWKHKKQSKSQDLDWKRTFINSIDNKMNRVYLVRDKNNPTADGPTYKKL